MWLKDQLYIELGACPSKNFNTEKSWDSVIFALIFSEFGYVTDFFYVPNFYYVFFEKLRQKRKFNKQLSKKASTTIVTQTATLW